MVDMRLCQRDCPSANLTFPAVAFVYPLPGIRDYLHPGDLRIQPLASYVPSPPAWLLLDFAAKVALASCQEVLLAALLVDLSRAIAAVRLPTVRTRTPPREVC